MTLTGRDNFLQVDPNRKMFIIIQQDRGVHYSQSSERKTNLWQGGWPLWEGCVAPLVIIIIWGESFVVHQQLFY